MNPEKVLVFGDDSRAFLAVVRSLGRRGLAVHVCAFDHASPALRSRHIAAAHRLPPYNLDPQAWVDSLRALLDLHRFALVVPCDDRAILPLRQHREAWGETRIALPNDAAFDAFFDKVATRALAQRAGVAVAAGEVLAPGAEAAALVRRYGLPLALKPRRSFEIERIAARRSVTIIASETELGAVLATLEQPDDYLVEAFFEGSGVGVSILAARGEVLQAFQHHRVFESGPTGGSTYRVSAALDPHLLAEARAVAAAAALHGVAMVEFRRNPDSGQAVLLEVNARFWGSLPLAIAAGVDFPAQLYDLLVEGRRTPQVAYRVGQYARSLANDAYRLARDLGDRDVALPRRARRMLGELALGLGRTLAGRESQDAFARDDLLPWLGEWRSIGRWLGGGVSRRLPMVQRLGALRQRHRLQAGLAAEAGRQRRILVLCSGNICRSPFAAALLARRLAGVRPDISVHSAGFLPIVGRASPDTAIAEAALAGIDLAAHRSRFVQDEDVAAADVVLVFDGANIADLARRGLPGSRAVMLGAFADPPGEIEDPFGGSVAVFRACYDRITRSVEALVNDLTR